MPAVFTRTVLDLAQKPALAAKSPAWQCTEAGLTGHGDATGSQCVLAVPDHYMLQCTLRLAPKAGIDVPKDITDAERLKLIQEKLESGHERRIELDAAKPITIQAFVQGSMIETFINDQYAVSCRAYDWPTGKLSLGVSDGEVRVTELKVTVHEPAGK